MHNLPESLQRLTQQCNCGPGGGDPKARGIEDYELSMGEESASSQCSYYASRGALGTLAVAACYVILSAFVGLPQPWERYFEFPGVPPTRDVESVVHDKEEDTGMDFDCTIGKVAWGAVWSLTQKAWCCRYTGTGCPPDNNYDCEKDLASWETWDQDKQYFCCGYDLEGCAGVVNNAKPQGKDCLYQLEDWENSWSPAKKKYCCEEHNFKCEMVPEVPTTCAVACHFGGVDATCQDRIDWLVEHPKPDGLQGEARACEQAHAMVTRDCDVCAPCSLEDAGCA